MEFETMSRDKNENIRHEPVEIEEKNFAKVKFDERKGDDQVNLGKAKGSKDDNVSMASLPCREFFYFLKNRNFF